jgi:ABC-type phosphate transport system substrate-binding protein
MRTAEFMQRSRSLCAHAARDLSDPPASALHHPRLITAVVVAFAVVAAAWIGMSLSRWRRITWRDHMDAPVSLVPKEVRRGGGGTAWKVFARHEEVGDPSLVLLRVKNSGFSSVSEADIKRPITFTFPGREVKEFTVTDCRGVPREDIESPSALVTQNRILLPRFAMRRRASFKLLVLLSGTGGGVHGKGYLRRGRIVRETRGRGRLARNISFGAALALLLGIQAGVTFSQAAAMPSFCHGGRLTLEGSTAFAPVARQIGGAYSGACPGADIAVTAISTFNGLNALNTGGQRDAATQIAMSDGLAPGGYPALDGHPVAVIIFAIVVNKQAGVFNLTSAELRGIFAGTVTDWRQAGGANLPVRIVSRTSGSGTRRAFDTKVLGGRDEPAFSSYDCVSKNAVPGSPVIRCEVPDTTTLLTRINTIPGAIGYAQISDAAAYANVETVKLDGWDPGISAVERDDYAFWTVEYLYTYGQPAPGTLAAAFLSYVNTDTSKDILRSAAYTPCADRLQPLPSTLCHS